jgi:DNA (cytosine-5)-methyltransferase 1
MHNSANTQLNHTVIDLFSGCGGFGLGAELAGFHCPVAVDIDEVLQSSYRLNFPLSHPILADIAALEKSAWRFLLKDRRPDGVIGGPPCQGFSIMGHRRLDDPRNTLVWHFFRQVALLDPKFFIMENVDGILDSGIDILLNACQQVAPRFVVLDPLVVTASDFGAPTCRKRVVVIGYNPDELPPLRLEDFSPPPQSRLVTVADAISDLPSPILSSRAKDDFAWSKYPGITKPLSEYAACARKFPREGLGWATAIDKLHHRESSGHEATIHSEYVSNRYGNLAPGGTCKVSKAKRLEWGGVCPTLRAGTGAEKGSHQAVRPIHPDEPRVITVREAARLQGFPDWFVFHPTKWSSFRMIGNSVSPKVSQFLLSRIMNHLRLQSPHNECNNAGYR